MIAMTQQINLFDRRFLRQKQDFSARQFGRALAAVAALFVGATVLQTASFLLTLRSRVTANEEFAALSSQATRLKAETRLAPNKELQDEVQRLEAAVALQEQLLTRLNAGDFGPTEGVSSYFTALARQTVDGVWLTQIRVDAKSGAIVLGGGVLKPEMLPTYLERIGREDALRGRTFEQLSMVAHDPAAASDRNAARRGARPAAQKYFEFELGANGPKAGTQ